MKFTVRTFTLLGPALALVIGLLASDTSAARVYNFGLKQVWSECAGPGAYNVRMTFQPVAGTNTYVVASGNQCRLRGAVCGINGGCGAITCSGTGPCELVLGSCLQGRGGSWAGIGGAGLTQRAGTVAPRRCQ